MADRFQDRSFPPDDHGRDRQHGGAESDPLAELARLIGQTDPFGTQGRPTARSQAPAARPPQPPVTSYRQESYSQEEGYTPEFDEEPASAPPAPPAWMRRANVVAQPSPPPQQDYAPVSPVHPLHRYATQPPAPPTDDLHPEAYAELEPDPSRYDDALYGRLESGQEDLQRDPAYPDDPYAYQSDYPEDELEDQQVKRRTGGMVTVAAILALAVVGTGAALAYKTYFGAARSGEPPIIRADTTPTKIVPVPSDGAAKIPDRMAAGDGTEKIVPREEAPVDINAKSGGPRVVFPPLNQNANPPPVASVAPSNLPPPSAGPVPSNGTFPNSEPRRIKTLAVRGDQTDSTPSPNTAPPATKPAALPKAAAVVSPAQRNPPTSANASAPLSLAPQGDQSAAPPTRMAATNPTQVAPAPEAASGNGYMVSVSSQDSEAAALASFRVEQGKYPSVLGTRSAVAQRATMRDGKIKYRAMVGPYRTRQEAVQFCTELKAAGGQCFIP